MNRLGRTMFLALGVLLVLFGTTFAAITGTTYRYDIVNGIGPWVSSPDDLHNPDMTVYSEGDLNDGLEPVADLYDVTNVAFQDGDDAGSGQPQPRMIWDLGAQFELGTTQIDLVVNKNSGSWAPHDVIISCSSDGSTWSAPATFSNPFPNASATGYAIETAVIPMKYVAGSDSTRYVQIDFMSDYGVGIGDWWTAVSEITFEEKTASPYIEGTSYKYDIVNGDGPHAGIYKDNLHAADQESFSTGDLNDGLTTDTYLNNTSVLFEDGDSVGSGKPQPRMIWDLGDVYALTGVQLDGVVAKGPGLYAPHNVLISISQDGVNWSAATDFENPFPNEDGDPHAEVVMLDVSGVAGADAARYVMIDMMSDYGDTETDWFTGLAEVNFLITLVPGDANLDGSVNEEDAAILASYWMTSGGANWGMGDFNGDGNVDDIDATLLATNWQTSTPSYSVPEPGLGIILTAGLLLICVFRRRLR